MLTGAFSLMGSGRGVDSSSLPLTRVSVSMSTSPSLLPPRGLEAPLDILISHEALIGPRLLRVEAGMKQLREDVKMCGPAACCFCLRFSSLYAMQEDCGWKWICCLDGEMQMHPSIDQIRFSHACCSQ